MSCADRTDRIDSYCLLDYWFDWEPSVSPLITHRRSTAVPVSFNWLLLLLLLPLITERRGVIFRRSKGANYGRYWSRSIFTESRPLLRTYSIYLALQSFCLPSFCLFFFSREKRALKCYLGIRRENHNTRTFIGMDIAYPSIVLWRFAGWHVSIFPVDTLSLRVRSLPLSYLCTHTHTRTLSV